MYFLRLLIKLGWAIAAVFVVYQFLIWLLAPEGPFHSAWITTRRPENRQQIQEIKEAVETINPVDDMFRFEPDPSIFDNSADQVEPAEDSSEDLANVEGASAEDSRTESAATTGESESEESRITTLNSSASSTANRSGRDTDSESDTGRIITGF